MSLEYLNSPTLCMNTCHLYVCVNHMTWHFFRTYKRSCRRHQNNVITHIDHDMSWIFLARKPRALTFQTTHHGVDQQNEQQEETRPTSTCYTMSSASCKQCLHTRTLELYDKVSFENHIENHWINLRSPQLSPFFLERHFSSPCKLHYALIYGYRSETWTLEKRVMGGTGVVSAMCCRRCTSLHLPLAVK